MSRHVHLRIDPAPTRQERRPIGLRRLDSLDATLRAPPSRAKDHAARLLPPEIAFLADFGAPLALLSHAALLARRQGVPADRTLIAEGLMSEDEYYRALASRIGADFVAGDFEPAPSIGGSDRGRGYVRLADNAQGINWICAPRGEEVTRLIGAAHGQAARARFAVTTHANFTRRLRRNELQQAALAAPYKVEAIDPRLCAQHALSRWRLLKTIIVGLVALGLLFQGDGALALLVALPLAAMFLGNVALRLAACAASFAPQPAPRRLDDSELPHYTVVVALYREARVARQLAQALDALDYPRAKLDILFVTESDDPATAEALRRHAPRAPHEILVAPPGAPKTKPRALNIAAPFVRGELLAVFDAEDLPHPRQLRRAAEKFAAESARVACLQASLAIHNGDENGWTAHFALDYAALFDAFNPGLCALGLPLFLGGTSNHFRVEILRKIGFWDAWNVTEDADLGLRLARRGYAVKTLASHTQEEAPHAFRALVNQRSRWMKGWMQTALTHCREPRQLWRDLGTKRTLATLAMFTGGFAGPLLGPLLTLQFLFRILFEDALSPQTPVETALCALWCLLALSGLLAVFVPMALGMRRRGLTELWPALILAPAWQGMLTIAAWRALGELWTNPYLWRKTEHGTARGAAQRARGGIGQVRTSFA